jgi:hypothetical protein
MLPGEKWVVGYCSVLFLALWVTNIERLLTVDAQEMEDKTYNTESQRMYTYMGAQCFQHATSLYRRENDRSACIPLLNANYTSNVPNANANSTSDDIFEDVSRALCYSAFYTEMYDRIHAKIKLLKQAQTATQANNILLGQTPDEPQNITVNEARLRNITDTIVGVLNNPTSSINCSAFNSTTSPKYIEWIYDLYVQGDEMIPNLHRCALDWAGLEFITQTRTRQAVCIRSGTLPYTQEVVDNSNSMSLFSETHARGFTLVALFTGFLLALYRLRGLLEYPSESNTPEWIIYAILNFVQLSIVIWLYSLTVIPLNNTVIALFAQGGILAQVWVLQEGKERSRETEAENFRYGFTSLFRILAVGAYTAQASDVITTQATFQLMLVAFVSSHFLRDTLEKQPPESKKITPLATLHGLGRSLILAASVFASIAGFSLFNHLVRNHPQGLAVLVLEVILHACLILYETLNVELVEEAYEIPHQVAAYLLVVLDVTLQIFVAVIILF